MMGFVSKMVPNSTQNLFGENQIPYTTTKIIDYKQSQALAKPS